jgi:hypothetical protein
MGNAYRIFVGKPEERKSLEDIGVSKMSLLEWILGT